MDGNAAARGLQLDVPHHMTTCCDQVIALEVDERSVDLECRQTCTSTALQQFGAEDLFEDVFAVAGQLERVDKGGERRHGKHRHQRTRI
jgi:hypothetical protein